MQVNVRREQRRATNATYSIFWQGPDGRMNSGLLQGIDISNSGIAVRCAMELAPDSSVYIQAPDGHPKGPGLVRHCTRGTGDWVVGIEFGEETKETMRLPSEAVDYYEFLQISPKAEPATIHRIYRFLASRFHPDNPETGDAEKFLMLNRAYEVLSDPERRAEYDATREGAEPRGIPIFESSEFVNGIEGELNRRLGVLSLLYNKRRMSSDNPRVSLMDLERWMAFPREYLDFTIWYLRNKKYICMEDNSEFALTALGVDYVEANCTKNPMLRKLLSAHSPTATDPGPQAGNGFFDERSGPRPGQVFTDAKETAAGRD